MGQIYYRQEKFEMAAYHFENSLKVCSRSDGCRVGGERTELSSVPSDRTEVRPFRPAAAL